MAAGAMPAQRRALQWLALLAGTVVLVALFERARLPAAGLLGAIIAGIAAALAGGAQRVPPLAMVLAQGLIGCMIARALHGDLFVEMAADWPVFLCMTLAVVALSMALGWLLAWRRVLPGTTAIWGSAPGAATAMMLMAEASGADARLTAFMQYLRVVMVAAVASTISAMLAGAHGAAVVPAVTWFPPLHAGPLAASLALALGGALLARPLRIPAGPLLLPMALGALLQGVAGLRIELPPWLLIFAYLAIGWSIGLRFTRPLLRYAFAALPKVLASIAALIAACGGLAWLLHLWTGRDAMTVYLATSPGGADSVAIIAASTHVDVAFVMAMQMARFLLVLFVGPPIARFVARRVPAPALP